MHNLFFTVILLFTACGSNSGRELSLRVKYKQNLEECTIDLDGITSYVEIENKFYYCNDGLWLPYK